MIDGQLVGNRPTRVRLAILDGFLGVTAVLGGLGLLFGMPFVSPPLDLLADSPVRSYVIPGLALLVLVGGGGLLATALLARRSPWGVAMSGAAGVLILGFEAVELVVIGFTGLLACYVMLGLLILVLAVGLRLAGGLGMAPGQVGA